ncbi:hypothetical protein [Granulicella tundricola]|uniref:Uncharacterized protein n=1 Tax=Granulicella tundricola (strain ATCC BAA-1859 / DSM 23138 / MP5ACTX9) TaxID=1198114 RepID=E8WZG4_GRATM|nr:hypothetical protein [Granulicella tundricola]ADW68852.1 hypothetical protein AciX9_1804 [Granulicella tundricola MP5ACTX9]
MLVFDSATTAPVDVAASHPFAFVWMTVLMLILGVSRVARGIRPAVTNASSYFHLWMLAYLVVLGLLMSLTTGIALVILYDPHHYGEARPAFDWLPQRLLPLAAGAAGVLGFEWLFRKFTVGFGQTQFDLQGMLDELVNQAIAATLKKDVG